MIAVLTDHNSGGTFVTWSLHYLAGHDKYFSAADNCWVELTDNPLTEINAHNFKSNQPAWLSQYESMMSTLLTVPTEQFHTIYFHNFNGTEKSNDSSNVSAIQHLKNHTNKVILLTHSTNYNLYRHRCQPRGRVPDWNNPAEYLADHDNVYNNFTEHFFKESKQLFEKLNLVNHWDQREFLALNLRPYESWSIADSFDHSVDHYLLDTADLYNTFNHSVSELFDYLELSIDSTRIAQWQTVYNKWQKLHYQSQRFVWYIDKIINYILNGHKLDLTRFNLDLVQEAIIQHILIYKHNLNLKTWQLEKFKDTQQLHNLLETNTHLLGNY